MNDFLPEAVRQGLEDARKAAFGRGSKLCVHDGDNVYRILRMWDDGFALEGGATDTMRGRVEIYDGVRHLYQCLVIGSHTQNEERIFDFKWLHPVRGKAPVDFEQDTFRPDGLITG